MTERVENEELHVRGTLTRTPEGGYQLVCESGDIMNVTPEGGYQLVRENGDVENVEDPRGVIKRFLEENERDADRTVKFLDRLDAAVTAATIVDFMMPNGKRFGDCTADELGEFGICRDSFERPFGADPTKGLLVFEGELYFGIEGTLQIYTVQREKLKAALKRGGEA